MTTYEEPLRQAFIDEAAERPDPFEVALPCPSRLATSLDAAIAARASCRKFSGGSISLEDVSTLLHAAYGWHGHVSVAGFDFESRPVPSAGAVYPMELHLVSASVAGLEPGTYCYLPYAHCLRRTGGPLAPEALCELFLGQSYLATASALAVIATKPGATLTRYGDRGYRYILLEAGHIAQNLSLVSGALTLGSLNLGGFLDQSLSEVLRLTDQVPIYAVALGRPCTADPQEVRQPR